MTFSHQILDRALAQYDKFGSINHFVLMRMFQITWIGADQLLGAINRIVKIRDTNFRFVKSLFEINVKGAI